MSTLQDAGIVILGLVLFLSESISAFALGALNFLTRSEGNVDGTNPESSIICCKHNRLLMTICCNSGERHYIDDGACLTPLSEVSRNNLLDSVFRKGCKIQGCVYQGLLTLPRLARMPLTCLEMCQLWCELQGF